MMPLNEAFAPVDTLPQTMPEVKAEWIPTTPKAGEVLPANFQHPKYGKPTAIYFYGGSHYRLRFEFPNDVGELDKEVLPCSICVNSETGERRWKLKAPKPPFPLFNADEIDARSEAPMLHSEGEKAAIAAQALLPDYVATTTAGGCKAAKHSDFNKAKGRDIVIWPDADEAGLKYAQEVKQRYIEAGANSVRILAIPAGKPKGWDVADALAEGWTLEDAEKFICDNLKPLAPASSLVAVDITTFLSLELKPQEMILDPIIPAQGLAMLSAYRGVGKTHVSLGIAYAVASGFSFLKWTAAMPRKVLLLDGEMPARTLQERFAYQVKQCAKSPPSGDYLKIITPDLQPSWIPSLSTVEGQNELEPYLEGVELLILDNISTLCRGGRENEAESWLPVQEWALSLRKRGISVLFIHHEGKNGQQRGTSRREDILDTSISLKRPADYDRSQGARFEVHYEKARGITGDAAKPFEARLEITNGKAIWHTRDLDDNLLEQVLELKQQDMSQRDIATDLGISVSKVNRLIKKAKEEGKKV